MKKSHFLAELEQLSKQFQGMQPELEVTVRDPSLQLEGYIVVWNTAISASGPLALSGKGGTRITSDLSLAEVIMLAQTMALKNAAAGLPLGGAKSGIKANSAEPNFEQKYRRFVSLVKPLLYENGGIFGGLGFDIGARPEHALWACDQLKSTRSFTGKPVELGGTDYDNVGIAGYGVAVAAETTLEFFKQDIPNCSYAVQGLGAMGSAVVRYFSNTGAQLKAVSDLRFSGTYIFNTAASPQVIELLGDQKITEAQAMLTEQAQFIPDVAAALVQAVDVLFPCATQGVITNDNRALIKAKYIVEGANNPATDEIRMQLQEQQGCLVIPDFIANPGGIIAAYVELTSQVSDQENAQKRLKVKEALVLTKEKITENVRLVLENAQKYQVAPTTAAKHLALSRMFAI